MQTRARHSKKGQCHAFTLYMYIHVGSSWFQFAICISLQAPAKTCNELIHRSIKQATTHATSNKSRRSCHHALGTSKKYSIIWPTILHQGYQIRLAPMPIYIYIYTQRAGLTVVNDSIVQKFLHHGHRLFSRFHFAFLQKPVHHVVAHEAVFVDAQVVAPILDDSRVFVVEKQA